MEKYEFRITRRTQRVHIFDTQLENAPKTSLCGEIRLEFTLPNRSEPMDRAKKYAMENTYICQPCADALETLAVCASSS